MCFEFAGRVLIGGTSMVAESAHAPAVSAAATAAGCLLRLLCLDGVVVDGVALRTAADFSVDDSLNGIGLSGAGEAGLLRRCDSLWGC